MIRIVADQMSGNPDGAGNMQVNEPPEEKNMPAAMPDVGVPSAPFQPREALLIRPHYLGREIRYPFVDFYTGKAHNNPDVAPTDVEPIRPPEAPVDPSLVPPVIEPTNEPGFENYPAISMLTTLASGCESLYSVEEFRKDLIEAIKKGSIETGTDQHVFEVKEFSDWEVIDACRPGEFHATDEGVFYKVLEGPEEKTVEDMGGVMEEQADEDFKDFFYDFDRKVREELGVDLEQEKEGDEHKIYCIVDWKALPELKDRLGMVESVTAEFPPTEMGEPNEAKDDEVEKAQNMAKLKIESPEEFGIKYKGELKQLAEERGLGDLLGYVFRTRKIDLIGTEKVLHLDYDMKPIHALELYPVEEV